MGRKSTAEKIINSLEDEEDDSRWVICYDFRVGTPLRRFYRNRDEIMHKLSGIMAQYSVFFESHRASMAITELARRYGAHVSIFRVDLAELDFV
jgi:hypothetical protein